MFIDAHSHRSEGHCLVHLFPEEQVPEGAYFSTGMHPWHLDNPDQQWTRILKMSALKECLAIGECGLDRLCATPIDLQIEFFLKHLKRATSLHKPMIVHCVKAHDVLLRILKENHPGIPVILHGFNQKTRIIDQLQKHCDLYISLGHHLLIEHSNARAALKHIPIDHLFLETDDRTDIFIEDIYQISSTILNLPLDVLEHQIEENFNNVFHAGF